MTLTDPATRAAMHRYRDRRDRYRARIVAQVRGMGERERGRQMEVKAITYFGKPHILACDGQCDKAWGINGRPRVQLSNDPDDYEWLADDELGEAPVNPGTFEGRDGKPVRPKQQLNKWCARECERSVLCHPDTPIELPDFSVRLRNILAADTTAAPGAGSGAGGDGAGGGLDGDRVPKSGEVGP